MLSKLIKYEFVKRWKASRYLLLGYVLLQALLLIITRSFFWNRDVRRVLVNAMGILTESTEVGPIGVPFVIAMLLYFFLALFIGMFPFIEGINQYEKDLSGKQSVLELMMPIISWKKIASKWITTLFSTFISVGLAALSVITFILVNSDLDKRIIDKILEYLQELFQSPTRFILTLLYIVFCYISVYMIILFCIAFSKSITQKNKIANLIRIVAFVLIVAALAFLNSLMLRIPLIEFTVLGIKDSLSSIIMSVMVFSGALLGTSWLMENKVEH